MARWFFGLIVALVALTPTAKAAEPEVKIGMYASMFRDVTPEMVAAIAKPLKSILERTVGLSGDAELVPDPTTLAKRLDEKKLQIGVFHGYEFAWQKTAFPNLEPIMVAVPSSGKLQAVVVVNIKNKAESVPELIDQKVLVPKAIKAHCLLYLDDLRKDHPKSAIPFENGDNVETILENLSAGKIDAAVVDASSLAAFLKNAPGNARVLKTIAKSETFPFAVLVSHKDGLTPAVRAKIVNSLGSAHTTAYGQPLMMLWGLKSFQPVPVDYSEQLATILKSYPVPKAKVVEGKLTGLEK